MEADRRTEPALTGDERAVLVSLLDRQRDTHGHADPLRERLDGSTGE